ncbi:MAG: hypothetical protein WB919_10960 [Candidatus Sulfotelmatobacter sp.]
MNVPRSRERSFAQKAFKSKPDVVRCSICNQPLSLESAHSDEYGTPVHEECYVLKTRLKLATTPPAA